MRRSRTPAARIRAAGVRKHRTRWADRRIRREPRANRACLDPMTSIAMFPLGSVLLPHMPLPLRVFESRYLAMLARHPRRRAERVRRRADRARPGGRRRRRPRRHRHGRADRQPRHLRRVDPADRAGGAAHPRRRGGSTTPPTRRRRWRTCPSPTWSDDLAPLLERADARGPPACCGEAEEAGAELRWPADVGLDDDPAAAAWQLAAIAPLGPLDQLDLLGSTSIERLLRRTIELTEDAELLYT